MCSTWFRVASCSWASAQASWPAQQEWQRCVCVRVWVSYEVGQRDLDLQGLMALPAVWAVVKQLLCASHTAQAAGGGMCWPCSRQAHPPSSCNSSCWTAETPKGWRKHYPSHSLCVFLLTLWCVCCTMLLQGALTVGDTVLFLTLMAQLYGPLSESSVHHDDCCCTAPVLSCIR